MKQQVVRFVMAAVAMLMVVSGGFGAAGVAQAKSVETVRASMVAYVSTLKDEVATADMPKLFPAIKELLENGSSPAELGKALAMIESVLDWKAVDESWKPQRDAWVSRTKGAETFADVAKSLLELEAATKWDAVGKDWAAKRDGWVSSLKAVSGD